MNRTAIIIGATGLVGSSLLNYLLKSSNYTKVILLARKNIEIKHQKLICYQIDFDSIESYKDLITGDDFFCCLGTTLKKAHTIENFKKVDFNYPLQFAQIAKTNKVKNFLLISSIGANSESGNYYIKTKGQLEDKIKELFFHATFIFRPSILKGIRNEFRLKEKISEIFLSIFSFLLLGKLKKYRPILATQVAKAMYKEAQKDLKGIYIFESDAIQNIE